jgi:hypothetical protein
MTASTAVAADRIAVVTRKTRLGELVERFNSRAQAKFWIERAGGDFDDYVREDDAYRSSLDRLHQSLELGVKLQFFERSFLPTFLFTGKEVVVALGQDGMVANVAKYVGEEPVVGVNPEPARFDGILLPFRAEGARAAVEKALAGTAPIRRVALAEVSLHDGQRLLAFNDFYLGMRTHVSSRYVIRLGEQSEFQSSSGLLVSTGAGSTGWISSVFNMAAGVTAFARGSPGRAVRLPWDDPRLLFAVREPFASRHSKASIVAGFVEAGQELVVESRMPSGALIFSDGVEADFLEFPAGATATIRSAGRHANLVAA